MPGYRPCAGIVLFNDDGKVLVCARADKKSDRFQFPQGGIEENETPAEAALRELKEETSITSAEVILTIGEPYIYNFPHMVRKKLLQQGQDYLGQQTHWSLLHFTGTDEEINLETEVPEFKSYKWINIMEAPSLIIHFKRQIYKKVCKILEPYMNAYLLRAECLVHNEEDEEEENKEAQNA